MRGAYPLVSVLSAAAAQQVAYLMNLAPVYPLVSVLSAAATRQVAYLMSLATVYPLVSVLSATATRQVAYLMSLALYIVCCLSCLPVIVLFLFMLMCRVRYTLPAGPPGNQGAGHQENYTYVHCVQFLSGPDDHCSAVSNDSPPLVGRVIVVSISSFAFSALLYSTLFRVPF